MTGPNGWARADAMASYTYGIKYLRLKRLADGDFIPLRESEFGPDEIAVIVLGAVCRVLRRGE